MSIWRWIRPPIINWAAIQAPPAKVIEPSARPLPPIGECDDPNSGRDADAARRGRYGAIEAIMQALREHQEDMVIICGADSSEALCARQALKKAADAADSHRYPAARKSDSL